MARWMAACRSAYVAVSVGQFGELPEQQSVGWEPESQLLDVCRRLYAKFTERASRSLVQKAVALIARGSLRAIMKELDYQEHGGVPVLGVNGVAIIGHGRSTPRAVTNMIFRAEEMVTRGVHRQIEASLARFDAVAP